MTTHTFHNKKAHFSYELGDTLEAGLVLVGDEIKAIRAGKISLDGSFGKILYGKDGQPELWLVNAHIDSRTHHPTRSRKLLAHRQEITKLIGQTQAKGFTLIPTKIFFQRGKAKVALALGRGRHAHDKRELIKKRDLDREQRRS
jgi:SsrA-binding protein